MKNTSQISLEALLIKEYEIEGKKILFLCCMQNRSQRGAKRRYSVKNLEALAVVWAVKILRFMLWKHTFEIVTDHNALMLS